MSYQSQIVCKLSDILAELQSPRQDTELTCVEENENLYIVQFSDLDESYHIYDFDGNDVTWTVTPMRCDEPEKYDVVYAGDFCDGWDDLSRYDIVQLSDQTILWSYFTDNTGSVVTPSSPVKGRCNDIEAMSVNLWAALLADGSTYTLPADVVSFAVSAQDWNFDISFDGWSTYSVTAREGVREYWDWNTIINNSDQITILSHWDIDIIRETI